ncbi:MAG: hypothetical protein U0132_20935 [Gemmatimonadaceae bacterium]
MSNLKRALTLTILFSAGACFPFFGGRPGQSGLARKVVQRKEPPRSLVASDNTRCLVDDQKYRETIVGTSVTCYWTSDHESRVVNGSGGGSANLPAEAGVTKRDAKGTAPAARKPN